MASGRPRSGALALASLAMAVLLPSIGSSMILTTMPIFMLTFDAPYERVQWLSAGFFAMLCIFSLPAGRLGDRIGRSRALIGGVIIFALSSAACAMAQDLTFILIFRVGQGIGGAAIFALIFALAADLPEGGPRSIAIGLLNGAQAFGTTAGPPIAGLILALAGWRWLFAAMAVLAVVAGLLIRFSFHEERSQRRPDTGREGGLLSSLAILLVIAGLMMVQRDWMIALPIGLAGLFVAAMVMRTGRPDPSLDTISRIHLLATGGMLMVMSTTLIAGSFLLSRTLRLDPVGVGLCLAVAPLVVVLVAVPVERLVRRLGERTASWATMAVFGGGIAMLALAPTPSLTLYLTAMFIVAVGYSGFQTAGTIVVMAHASPSQRGFAASSISLARNMGMICGTTVLGQIFIWLVHRHGPAVVGISDGVAVGAAFQQLFRINMAIVALIIMILWCATRHRACRAAIA